MLAAEPTGERDPMTTGSAETALSLKHLRQQYLHNEDS